MLRNMLSKWGYEVVQASDGEAAWRILATGDGPRLAIVDWMMPGIDGPEVCRRVRALGGESYTYILLLTARTERRDLLEGMEAGADDYLTKPFNAHELRVRLRAGRRILELQAKLVEAREALRLQATRDGLTGIWNRTAILEILRKELARGLREHSPVAVLMADLDHFKQVNDTHGHMAGDEVLREAARRIQSGLRSYDAVGRYGGEEFLMVLPGCGSDAAAAQAERLRQTLCGKPFSCCGTDFHLTCSLGASWSAAPTPEEADALVRCADEALYAAKRKGRNRVALCPPCGHLAGVG
jgi:diguanylate cyclase (GGDEF)-like protein